jgi:hypothetical protein
VPNKICAYCGNSFDTQNDRAVYCCRKHKENARDSRNGRNARVSTRRHERNNRFVVAYKTFFGCALCPETNPICLDLHHLNPADKNFSVSQRRQTGLLTLVLELAKCSVLCANCHRKVEVGYLLHIPTALARCQDPIPGSKAVNE